MPFIAARHIANYGGRAYVPGDTIYKVPNSNEATWRAFIERRWIVQADETRATAVSAAQLADGEPVEERVEDVAVEVTHRRGNYRARH